MEHMEDRRPYWKVAASLLVSLIGTVVFVVAGFQLMGYFMPFVIGWVIAMIANPVVRWLEKRLKIVRKLGSAIIIVMVLGLIVTGLYFGFSKAFTEIKIFIDNFPEMYQQFEEDFRQIGREFQGIFHLLPAELQVGWDEMVNNMDQGMADLITGISEPTVTAAGNFAKRLPSILIAVIVTVISAYIFIAERDEIIVWSKKIAPSAVQKKMTMVVDNFKYAVGGYFKAQFKIMIVVALILSLGLAFLKVKYVLLCAILIALLDFLPFFGTGTAMIPWAVFEFLTGDYKLAIGLIILYATTQLVRQLIQPKLVADSMGLTPLVTLVLLYVGYKMGSVFGMILAVPAGMIVINMYKAGAFDYILDDVKILLKGIQKLREP
ncbi:sporulation integral membrane protein YtvI [Lachnospiraceae bacterium 6_1_37FAA]|nr:sporulation integral membrane protein YtvI [Lachnospiraceae bacterium 6_1_37FAA]